MDSRLAGLKTVVVATWLLLVVGIVVALADTDSFLAVDGRSVALLEHRSGGVQVRREGLVRWQDAVERQGLFDGDRVATGRGAKARVGMGPKRSVSLGEDSQIQITAIVTKDPEAAFMVTLLRGSVVADIGESCAECPPIVVRAGDDTYRVASGHRVGIFKPAGGKARRFSPKGPWPEALGRPSPLINARFLQGDAPLNATPAAGSARALPAQSPSRQ